MAIDTNSYDKLLAPATGGGNSASFKVTKENAPVSVVCPGIATGETGSLQFSYDNGTTWTAAFKSQWAAAGAAMVVGVDGGQNHPLEVTAPGLYRVVKSATAASVGVYIKKGNF